MRNETLAVDDALSDVREVMIRCKKQKVQKCEEQVYLDHRINVSLLITCISFL